MPAYNASLFDPPAPMAHVTLRIPGNGTSLSGVPMLLDSGADVTLVQRSFINRLGAILDPDTTYEVYAFDGTVTFAQSVELDLGFLDRNFTGRFLITDEDVGILCRDILNLVSLVLDGPQLFWSEERTPRI